MEEILAGLDAVDWPSYKHAYGAAEDTPDRLRGALAGEEKAVFKLLASLFHQGGGVYPAAVPAMPFLIALGCEPAVPERIAVLDLLGLFTGLLSDVTVKGRTSPESVALRAVMEEALPRLVALLDDPDPAVRREAVKIVAACPFGTDLAGSALREFSAREDDEGLRVAAVLAFCRLAAWMSEAERVEAAAWVAGIGEPFAALAVAAASEKLVPGSVPIARVLELLESPDLPARLYAPAVSAPNELIRWADAHFEIPGLRRRLADWVLAPRHASTAGLMLVGEVLLDSRQATAELVPAIAALLDHDAAEVRGGAAHLLAAAARTTVASGAERTLVVAPFVERLAAALGDPDDGVVTRAVWALAMLGDARAVPYLAAEIRGETERFDGSRHYGRYYFALDDTPDLGFLLARMQEHADVLDLAAMRPTERSDPASRPHQEPSEAQLRALVAGPERQLGSGGWRGIAEDDEAVEIAVAELGGNRRTAS